MKTVLTGKHWKDILMRSLFLLQTILFVTVTVFPELQQTIGIELTELEEEGESDSKEKKKEGKEKISLDEYLNNLRHLNALADNSQKHSVMDTEMRYLLLIDVLTPPPEQA